MRKNEYINTLLDELADIAKATLELFQRSRLKSRNVTSEGEKTKVTTLSPSKEVKIQSERLAVRYEDWAIPIRTFLQKYSFVIAKRFEDCFEAAKSYVLLARVGTDLDPKTWRDLFIKEFVSLIELQRQIILDADTKFNLRKLNFFCFKNLKVCNVPARFNPRLVFTLIPFSEKFLDVYNMGVKPVVESLKLAPMKADEMQHSRDILCGSICQPIQESRLIIADLSGRNPNVFYELGLAHGFEKEIVLIVNNIEDVPFDLRGMNIIIYKNVSELCKKLKKRIVAIIKHQSDKTGGDE